MGYGNWLKRKRKLDSPSVSKTSVPTWKFSSIQFYLYLPFTIKIISIRQILNFILNEHVTSTRPENEDSVNNKIVWYFNIY